MCLGDCIGEKNSFRSKDIHFTKIEKKYNATIDREGRWNALWRVRDCCEGWTAVAFAKNLGGYQSRRRRCNDVVERKYHIERLQLALSVKSDSLAQ